MMSLKKSTWILIIVILIFGGFGIWIVSLPKISASEVASYKGLHWHSKLYISIKGKDIEIPANVNFDGMDEGKIHTHETDHILHMEQAGLVKFKDLTLGAFFSDWGKTFSHTCIFDSCTGPDGTLSMTVNGTSSPEFENYSMKDGDEIKIEFK